MTNLRLGARHAIHLALGVAFVSMAVACGEEGESSAPGEAASPIANGRPGGGVGVVRLRITNGTILPNGAFDDFFCTGTVISNDRILTAGHCVSKWLTIKQGSGTTVLLRGDLLAGAEYTNDGTSWFCLQDPSRTDCLSTRVSVHVTRLGDGNIPPDIAVLRFATPFRGIDTSTFRLVSTGTPRVNQPLEVWGAGFTNPSATAGGLVSQVMTRALVRVASISATQLKVFNNVAQICLGDSGGPFFSGASDGIVAVMSQGLDRNGGCELSIDQSTATRVTPAVINLIDGNRGSADPACHETVPGTGITACF